MNDESAAELPRVGFLGLGTMGAPMVLNLLHAGYSVVAYDKTAERVAACADAGAVGAGSEEAVVERADVVMTSLPSSAVFVSVAEEHLVSRAREGQMFIDLGTTEAPETRRLAGEFARRGASLLDVPVSGGRQGSETGSLRMFVGGDPEAARQAMPLLHVLGDPERVVYCGPSGAGQVVKAVNQLAMGLADAAYLEAVAFGVRSGAPPDAIAQAVGGDEGWRGQFGRIARRVAAGHGDDVLVKFPELRYSLAEAQTSGFSAPLLRALYAFCCQGEQAWRDNMGRPRPSLWHELMNRPT